MTIIRVLLGLWLALTEPGLSRLNMMGRHEGRANRAQRRIASRMPLGGFAEYDGAGRLAVAALAVPSGLARRDDRPLAVTVRGYGPSGAALAGHLAERAVVWDRLARPGARRLELAVHPAGTRPEVPEGGVISCRPNTVLVAGWPTAAWP
jgi:hypothetical protein